MKTIHLLLLAAIPVCLAQQPVYTVRGGEAGAFFGQAMCAVDVNADGTKDLIVGASIGTSFAGFVAAFDGPTGRRLWLQRGENPGDCFGYAVAVMGDIDGDGIVDLAVGAPEYDDQVNVEAGAVYLLSGRTGAILRRAAGDATGARFGASVASAGDGDGDGLVDVAGAEPDYVGYWGGPLGRVRLLRSSDLQELRHWDAPVGTTAPRGLGTYVADFSDVFAPGPAVWMVWSEPSNMPMGRVRSSATGAEVFTVAAFGARGVSLGGDVDGNGTPDFLVTQHGFPGPGLFPQQYVWALGNHGVGNGPSTLNFIAFAAGNLRPGTCMASVGDIDGDGRVDYLVGSADEPSQGVRSGCVYCISGGTNAVLFTLCGAAYESFGESCTGLGDVDGDGIGDFAIGAPFARGSGNFPGEVRVYSGRSLRLVSDVSEVSAASGGRQLLSIDLGAPLAGMPYLILGSMSGNRPGVSLQGVNLPLNVDFYTSFTLTSANGPVLQGTFGMLDAQGRAQASVQVPASLALTGLAVLHSCLWFDQGFLLQGATGTVPLRIAP